MTANLRMDSRIVTIIVRMKSAMMTRMDVYDDENLQLTQNQENVIKQIVSFWKNARYVSSASDCHDWIKAILLNPNALSACGNIFLKRINVVIKLIREQRFSKPFIQRYQDYAQYKANKAPKNIIKPEDSNVSKSERSAETRLREERVNNLNNQVKSLKVKISETIDSVLIETYQGLIQKLRFDLQEVQYAG